MCLNAETYLSFLEPLLTEPQRADVMMEYLDKFYEPFKYLTKEPLWVHNTHVVDLSNNTLEEHLPAIEKYLGLLSMEEEVIDVTNPPN